MAHGLTGIRPIGVGAVAVAFTAVLTALTALPAPSASAAAGPSLTVDEAAGRHPISSDVYGMNYADGALATELGVTADRWGGNSTSRYNFQNNTYNTGSDWYFENIVASQSLDSFVTADLAHGTNPVVTVPAIGWVSKDSPGNHPFACGFKVSKYGAQQSTDPWDADCGNGKHANGSPITGNAPTDTSIAVTSSFAQSMVGHLVQAHGAAAQGGVRTYEIDNEPTLWNSTHVDVHPNPLTYDELWQKSSATALAIKTADPSASVDGPGDWGWCAYFYAADDPGGCGDGPDRQAHGDLPLAAWYLQQFHGYEQSHGVRLLDYFDEHFYPQQSGVALASAGDAATQALRLRSTRALWDPSYNDESWTTDLGLGPVELIPRMQQWVAQYYPGTKIAISEYNWGGLESMNGALAEADVLGIFGREGVDRAQLWSPPTTSQPGAFAFRMYRDYDGHGGKFGDVSVQASSSDQGQLAVYAAQRNSDGALTVMVVNKTGNDLTSTLSVRNADAGVANVYTYSPANLGAIVPGNDEAFTGGSLTRSYVANSITLLVLPNSNVHVTRIGGANRDATAAALATASFPSSGSANAVVLARDDVYADALTGSPLARALGGPLLLTPPTTLSADARTAIASVLGPSGAVYVLGNANAVSEGVVSTLRSAGYSVTRIGGADRFATATLIADQIASVHPIGRAYLATGLNFADAESAAGAAAASDGVVLLTNGDSPASATTDWLSKHAGLPTYAVGGAAATAVPGSTSYVGADRYATSALVAASVLPAPPGIAIATGTRFPDGLAGSAYAARLGWPLLLVSPTATGVDADQQRFLHGAASSATALTVIGQTTAVPDAAVGVVLNALR